jgi:parvulin-like peptidyl-prolyl isomerase
MARAFLPMSLLLVTCLASFTSCSRQSSPKAESGPATGLSADCVARVGDISISRQAFEQEFERRGDWRSKDAVLEQMIRSAALLSRARAIGYDRDPEVVARINQFIVARFQEDQWAKQSAALVDESDVEGFYQRNSARFTTPEAVRASILLVKCSPRATEGKRAELKRKAESLLTEARQANAEGFVRLVGRHSEDQSTRYVGGDTGWLHADGALTRWPAAVSHAAFTLTNAADFAPLVATTEGFYIVRLSERKAAFVRPFDEAREGIKYQLTQERKHRQQREFFEEMKSGLKIEINSPLLESIPSRTRANDQQPPTLPRS